MNKIKRIVLTATILSLLLFTGSTVNAVNCTKAVYNIADNQPSNSITFNNGSGDSYKLANQYIRLDYQFNQDIKEWKIELKGELRNIKHNHINIPLACRIEDSAAVPAAFDPDSDNSGWYSIMNGAGMMSGTDTNSYKAGGNSCGSPVYIYMEGDFSIAAAGGYTGSIELIFYDLTDKVNPKIVHIPIAKIGMVGNRIVIEADVTDDRKVVGTELNYKINGGDWQKRQMNMEGQAEIVKRCYSVFEPEELTGSNIFKYYLEASDGTNVETWKSQADPQNINISRITKFPKIKTGFLKIEDGNPDDGETSLELTEGSVDGDLEITIEQCDMDSITIPEGTGAASSKKPVAVYRLEPDRYVFKKPIKLTLLYFDLLQTGTVQMPGAPSPGVNETELGLFYWDDFEWRLVSRDVDKDNNTVTGTITHFSMYAIFPVSPLTAADYRPKRKIITPATPDTINDTAGFDAMPAEFEIKIYDITGRLVRTIDETDNSGANWDGADEYGNIVESGVYIYQFRADVNGEQELISGTIAVAK
ncbi:MAG: hypothetical protein ABIH89_07440 [Elusimicrobiota bacterium]